MAAWRYEISLLALKKIFHSFAALTREIFFNTRREISYLREHVISSIYVITIKIKQNETKFAYSKVYALQKFQVALCKKGGRFATNDFYLMPKCCLFQ